MSGSSLETRTPRNYIIQCIKCKVSIPPGTNTCPQCGTIIAPGTVRIDTPIDLKPSSTNALNQATTNSLFAPHASVLLRFMPLGQTLSFSMRKPLTLGRTFDVDVEKTLDLTDYGGVEHGISRKHCQLERRGSRLIITDLGSTNGTYLNGSRIAPHTAHTVAHGDRLILGTMHMLVLFSTGH
jgi:pSer/pThr/pTyr-binding forkhead associated (FHA) protein